MPITIHKLSTQCRVSLRCRPLADVADRLARNRLVGELSQLLGPALSRQDPVIRIRRLSVKLRLGTHDFTEDLLPSAWARAVAKSLFEALGRSANGSSEDVVRYPSLVHFHAAYIRDLLAGRSHGRWEYAEFEPLQSLSPVQAAMEILLRDPRDALPLLTALDVDASLDLFLARLDELAIEQLFIELARLSPPPSHALVSLEDLLWAAGQCALAAKNSFPLDSRQFALRFFVRSGGPGRSPRVLFHSMLAIVCLLECPALLRRADSSRSVDEIENITGRRLPPAVVSVLQDLNRVIRDAQRQTPASIERDSLQQSSPSMTGERVTALLTQLNSRIESLRPLVPTAAPAADVPQPPWIEMDHASLLLLVAPAIRLGWGDLPNDPLVRSLGGQRIVHYLMAQIGQAICGDNFDLRFPLDPATQTFAGIGEEPDLVGMRVFFESSTVSDRRALINQMAPGHTDDAAATWESFIDALATRLVLAFGEQVRGFRSAGRAALVRQFLRHPGRVQVRDRSICVMLARQPLHAALRIAGADGPVPSVPWINGRQLEFVLLEN